MENDLDKIIQTMLLDEIVQQLDSVLDKLDNAIINQRKQIALQEYQNEMIARNHQEEMRALASISKNQYLQTAYLLMIEGNARTSKFFLGYDFLENY